MDEPPHSGNVKFAVNSPGEKRAAESAMALLKRGDKEIRRLRAENDKLRAALKARTLKLQSAEIEKYRAENEALTAKCAELEMRTARGRTLALELINTKKVLNDLRGALVESKKKTPK